MKRTTVVAVVLFILAGAAAKSQDFVVPFVAMGDSISEGVQSADASFWTQPLNFTNLIAQQMGVRFPLPLILGSPIANVRSTAGRVRISPSLRASNLAVSGATINDLLNSRFTPPVNTETDLVLMPRTSSQIEIAEALRSPFHTVWIGNNDVLDAILDWQNLNASQMTSFASFTADYANLIQRLSAWNTKVVVGTIPDVTVIGFLFNPQDLVRFVGSNFGLPQGSYTSLPVMLLIKLGFDDGSLIQDPNYVLDSNEVAMIQDRTLLFNQSITQDATMAGMGVADTYSQLLAYVQNPPVFYGLPLNTRFLGGMLSLDGVHPSNIFHALAANVFIRAANSNYGLQIPLITQDRLNQIAANDPFIDWNGNLVVRGRPFAGLLETLGPFIGISGEFNEGSGSLQASPNNKIDRRRGEIFKQQYLLLKGLPASTPWTLKDAIAAMKELFGR